MSHLQETGDLKCPREVAELQKYIFQQDETSKYNVLCSMLRAEKRLSNKLANFYFLLKQAFLAHICILMP